MTWPTQIAIDCFDEIRKKTSDPEVLAAIDRCVQHTALHDGWFATVANHEADVQQALTFVNEGPPRYKVAIASLDHAGGGGS